MLCFVSVFVYGEMLTIDDYMYMVAKNNSDLKLIQANINAVKGKLAEIERVYAYSLNMGISYSDDKSGRPYNQLAKLNEVSNWNYSTSVNKQFKTGTQFFLGINGAYGTYDYAPSALGESHYNVCDIFPFIKLQQSLWKDINGCSTKAGIYKQKANAKSVLYLLEYKKQKLLLDAKIAYWNLSYTRTVIDFRKASLDRKKRLLNWNQIRYKMDLTERADLLQSQAAVKFGELNLKLAYEDESRANKMFNQFLNIKDDKLRHDVEKFEDNGSFFKTDITFTKNGTRADVLAVLEDINKASYDQKASQRNKGADLVLEGKYSFNGVEQFLGESFNHVKNGDRPSYSLGLKYTLPLDFKLRKVINKGYEAAKVSAQIAAESAVIKENSDWVQLLDDWDNARTRMELAIEVEKIQKQRYEEDRNLFKKGRITTHMVLQGEDDSDIATLSVFKNILELIQISEQAKIFYSGVGEEVF
ncbi:MAG: TolC family protein [Endomicrobium sp.]|jgi:hypothetical protein|nr:TolC family protein [Endomicrobium sp.]